MCLLLENLNGYGFKCGCFQGVFPAEFFPGFETEIKLSCWDIKPTENVIEQLIGNR